MIGFTRSFPGRRRLAQAPPRPENLYLIDGIGPFFRGYKKFRINWSKIPWERIQRLRGERRDRFFAGVRRDLEIFCEKAREIGCNAISLDDLPHLADHEFYEDDVRAQMALDRADFRPCFQVVRQQGLRVFLTMDVMVYTPALLERVGTREGRISSFLTELLDRFFGDFPEVDGVILRIGEADGQDVRERFHSQLVMKNPGMVNRFLRTILPVFEKHRRTCVFRTWTVGVHRVGDLIWHDSTLTKTIRGIRSPALVLSMKYGESDFFRYLSLNRNFFVTDIPTIVELQTRREYEGCGEFPSFIGGDYGQFALELREAPNCIGVNLWSQTGGWTPFRRLVYLEEDAIWTEINNFVTLRLFKYGDCWEEAVEQFPGCNDPTTWIELLRLSEEVIKELLYVPDYAKQTMYFRRVRIPPIMGVFWHNIFVAHAIKRMLTHFVEDGEACIRQGHAALEKIRRMRELARRGGLPEKDIAFMEDTFSILALAREYFFRPHTPELEEMLMRAKAEYKAKYPRGSRYRYALKIDLDPFFVKPRHLAWFAKYILRDRPDYRFIDKILGLRLLSYTYLLLKRARPKMIPQFAQRSAMGIDAIFK